MTVEVLHGSLDGSGTSVTSVVERGRDSVTPVEDTEPGHAMPDDAWFDDPDAHFEEVHDYMRRLHRRCDSSDEFVAALSGLFPDLKEKVDKSRALAMEDLGDDDLPDPDADIAEGRYVTFLSGAEMIAADLAMLSDPVVCD